MSEFWPHQFTKDGPEVKVGEEHLYDDETSKTMRPIFNQPMICVHCHVRYMRGKEAQPQGACPARNDKREKRRILG